MHQIQTMLATGALEAQGVPQWALLIPILPLAGFVIAALCAAFKVKSKLPAYTTVATVGAAFVTTLMLFLQHFVGEHASGPMVVTAFEWIKVSWGDGIGQTLQANFGLYLDSLTVLWMLFVTGLATLIALYASEYMSHDVGAGYCRFFAAFSLFVFSMSCLVMADNLILLYLGWEGVGLCSYLLIGYFYKKPSAVAAAKKAFIVNRIGDLFLALGIFLIFVHFGSVEYKEIFARAQPYIELVKAGKFEEIPAVVGLIPLLLMGGAFGKSAQLPLYVWLPDAMEGPTPVSALIHAATMVTAGVFLIARTYAIFLLSDIALPAVAWVGALTALVAATIGMAQFDIKRIMAYSTVSQLGYMFAGLGVLTSMGGVFHVVTHAFFKALLFLCCGAVMHGFGGQLDLRKLSGLMKMPGWRIVSIGMLVGCLNLAGFPFITAGFYSKDMILAEAFTTPGAAPIGWILLITAGLTAYYTFRVFFRVFVGPKHYEMGEESHGSHDDHHGHGDHGHDPHGHGDHAHDHHGQHGHAHGHDAHGAHPHAPGWAINTVLVVLSLLSIAAVGLAKVGGSHGAVADLVQQSSASFTSPFVSAGHHEASSEAAAHAAHGLSMIPMSQKSATSTQGGGFFGMDAHTGMIIASSAVGIVGIIVAFFLHFAGRTTAATSKADSLLPVFGKVAVWAQNKWYVDELYEAIIRKPLWVLTNIFHLIDQFIVDGIVDVLGRLPRSIGQALRPSQSGELHGYAVGMAGGIVVLLLIVFFMAH